MKHPIRAKAHDAGVMRAVYLDERDQLIEQARAVPEGRPAGDAAYALKTEVVAERAR